MCVVLLHTPVVGIIAPLAHKIKRKKKPYSCKMRVFTEDIRWFVFSPKTV